MYQRHERECPQAKRPMWRSAIAVPDGFGLYWSLVLLPASDHH